MVAHESLFLLIPSLSMSLQNGLGKTPAMGYSSWNDCASEVTEERIKNVTMALITTGLAAKGYIHVNIDEGWLKSRASDGTIVEDKVKFPSGMKALGDWVHDQVVPGKGKIMKYGLYTSRGTCQCSTKLYHGPGSHGHVAQDAGWFADAGADYLKEDSCCGSQDHETAFGDYAEMRDALNKTGRPVYFSLCGWRTWYAPQGDNLGNSWRIGGDGTNWGALSARANDMAGLQQYAKPGAWNDPDLLQGTGRGSNDKRTNPAGCFAPDEMPQTEDWYQTEAQSKAQFTLWAVMSAPLLISADPGQVGETMLSQWGNTEIIEVSQTFRAGGPYQGTRLVGGDLEFRRGTPDHGSGSNVWGKLLPGGDFALAFVSNEDTQVNNVTCDGDCFDAMFRGSADVKCPPGAGMGDVQCLGLKFVPSADSAAACAQACCSNPSCKTSQWCASDAGCAKGGSPTGKTPGCYIGDMSKCHNSTEGWVSVRKAGPPPSPRRPTKLSVRDLWEHSDLRPLAPPYSFTAQVGPHGGVAIYRFSPK